MHERPGDQEPAPHAARELVDPGVAAVAELRHLDRSVDRGTALCAWDAVEVREDQQVLLDGEGRVEIVELRRDAELGARLLRLVRESITEELELSLVGDRLGGEKSHRGRLPGAVRPEQPDAGALGHVEVEAVDGGDLPVALDDPSQANGELPLHRRSMHQTFRRQSRYPSGTNARPNVHAASGCAETCEPARTGAPRPSRRATSAEARLASDSA